MVLHYKCPNCGSDMSFDSNSGALSCDSCGRQDNIDLFPEANIITDQVYSASIPKQVSEYHCKNCGAVLITDHDTSATKCNFCGAGVVLMDRLSGEFRPAKVIPFSIDRNQAEAAFQKWTKKSRLTPKRFRSADRIKSLTGLYVPYWLYDMNSKGDATAACTKVRSYSDHDYTYTETKHYQVHRGVNLTYTKIPADASAKLDDGMMDRLEPFDYNNLKPFKMPYLAGYIAEKYNFDENELLPRIRERLNDYTRTYIRNTITGYTTVHVSNESIRTSQLQADYVLLPVWMLCYDYDKTEYMFLMNGQTGKIVGKPPISYGKMFLWFFLILGISFCILMLFFEGGVF